MKLYVIKYGGGFYKSGYEQSQQLYRADIYPEYKYEIIEGNLKFVQECIDPEAKVVEIIMAEYV